MDGAKKENMTDGAKRGASTDQAGASKLTSTDPSLECMGKQDLVPCLSKLGCQHAVEGF